MTNDINVTWAETGIKEYSDSNFLRIKPGCNLKLRLIGLPIGLFKVFTTENKCILLDTKENAYQLKKDYPEKISNVSTRYVCKCINRGDQELKILDMPITVAKAFGSRAENVEKNISARREGCDWAIRTNGKTGKDCRYEVIYVEETPLTDNEYNMVQEKKELKEFNIEEMFNTNSLDEAINLIK